MIAKWLGFLNLESNKIWQLLPNDDDCLKTLQHMKILKNRVEKFDIS
jgi:hypothetical protein